MSSMSSMFGGCLPGITGTDYKQSHQKLFVTYDLSKVDLPTCSHNPMPWAKEKHHPAAQAGDGVGLADHVFGGSPVVRSCLARRGWHVLRIAVFVRNDEGNMG